MKAKNFMSKTFIALVMLLGTQQVANAQIGGLLNKAKSAVKSKANDAVEDAKKKADKEKDKVQAKVDEKQASLTLGNAPECPWVMAVGVNEADVTSLVDKLGTMDVEKTKAFAAQIDARAKYDKDLLANMQTGGAVPFNATLFNQATEEMRNWENLFGKIVQKGDVMGPNGLKKTDNGWNFEYEIKIIVSTKEGIFVTSKDNKGIFCSLGGDGIYVDEDKLPIAKEVCTFNLNAAVLLEGFAQYQDKALERNHQRALIASKLIAEAISNNSPANLEQHARPKAGSMNGAWKAKALALAKQKFPNATDVIIVSDSWDVKTNALGVPINRIIYGYVLTNEKAGTKATRVSWDQKHQGGGKYGELKNYGVAAESPFFVK